MRISTLLFLFFCVTVQAQDGAPLEEKESVSVGPDFVQASEKLDYTAAAVLGVVEGLTEYLPVSSTGHLIIANHLLGLESEIPVLDKSGNPLVDEEKPPLPLRLWGKISGNATAPAREVPFTLKNAADTYIIVIQFGAILAVLFAYWKRVEWLILGVLARRPDSLLLARNLLLAFLPAAVIGLLFNSLIEELLFGLMPVILALFAGSFAMLWVEKRHRRLMARAATDGPDLHELSVAKSLGIGLAQCCALWPGTSRSMASICGGYLVGLNPARATEFSFLLGLITLSAASVYKTASKGKLMLATFENGPLLAGLLLATITAFFAVKWMVGWINRHGLALFAWYRIALALVLTLVFFT